MANQEQLQRLLTGAPEEWNRWPTAHPEIQPDLAHARLSKTRLRHATLHDCLLHRACLDQTDLRGVPWPLILSMTRQPGIIWKQVLHDEPEDHGSPAPLL